MHACMSDRRALLLHRKSTKFHSTQFHRPVSKSEDLNVTVQLDIIEGVGFVSRRVNLADVPHQCVSHTSTHSPYKLVKFLQTMLNDLRSVRLLLLMKLLTCRKCRRSQCTSWSRRLFTLRPAASRKGSGSPAWQTCKYTKWCFLIA